jgi:hypothetical protein
MSRRFTDDVPAPRLEAPLSGGDVIVAVRNAILEIATIQALARSAPDPVSNLD